MRGIKPTAFNIFSAVRRWLEPLWPCGLPTSCSSSDDGLPWRVTALPFLDLLALAMLKFLWPPSGFSSYGRSDVFVVGVQYDNLLRISEGQPGTDYLLIRYNHQNNNFGDKIDHFHSN